MRRRKDGSLYPSPRVGLSQPEEVDNVSENSCTATLNWRHDYFNATVNNTESSEHTFLPAYLPRVMMATRPTLRTAKAIISIVIERRVVIYAPTLHDGKRSSRVDECAI